MKTRTESSVWTRFLGLICVIGLLTQVTLAQANISVQVDKPGFAQRIVFARLRRLMCGEGYASP